MLTGTKPEEDLSYGNINICIVVGTVSIMFTSVMEMLTYYLYNNKVFIIYSKQYCTMQSLFQFHPMIEILPQNG